MTYEIPILSNENSSRLRASADPGRDAEWSTTESATLLHLDQRQAETIAQSVPGGPNNVQDVYPATPLQEGILFHRLLNDQSDTYILSVLFELESSACVDGLIRALQKVIDRHDVLRTALVWGKLVLPMQAVLRDVKLRVEEFTLDPERDSLEQLKEHIKPVGWVRDLTQAPLMWLQLAADPRDARRYAILRVHHLVCDFQSLKTIIQEALILCENIEHPLPPSVPFRGYVEEVLSNASSDEAEEFFRETLGDIDESTAPFGLLDVHRDGTQIEEAHLLLDDTLSLRIRAEARRAGMSAARLFHAVWALVVARLSGRDDIVFGTVLMTVQPSKHAHPLGLFINTLPLRLTVGDRSARELVEEANRRLGGLLKHRQTALTVAQRCSGMTGAMPLFTTLLNCRRSVSDATFERTRDGSVRVLDWSGAGLNYPIAMMVDDLPGGFALTARTVRSVDPRRIVDYVHTAIESLVQALERSPQTPACSLSIIPPAERRLLDSFNRTQVPYFQDKLIHELFEEQVLRTPDAPAVEYQGRSLTYVQLNRDANRLASFLRSRGAGPEQLVGVCVERTLEMVVGLLGVLKSGAAYVPLDPNYPSDRLAHMLRDTAPRVLLTHDRLTSRLPPCASEIIALDGDWLQIAAQPSHNMDARLEGLHSRHLAYVIYTSGSTGDPKGVAIEHRSAVNLISWARSAVDPQVFSRTLQSTSLNFDLAVYECFVPLTTGGGIVIVENALALLHSSAEATLINTVPSVAKALSDSKRVPKATRVMNLAGEALKEEVVNQIFDRSCVERVCNLYGPSETTTYSTWVSMSRDHGFDATIGVPIANTQIYILDKYRQNVPIGVVGEIHIGGAGVARGYLNRPELTAERFLADPFDTDPRGRMYKTGDLGRWRPDGTIEYLGRNDHQVKIRGYRIELGEIESQLVRHGYVREAVVTATEDSSGVKRLIAYVTLRGEAVTTATALREYLRSLLPDYMIPSAFVVLESLPLTLTGKLDRRALPLPEVAADLGEEHEAPQGALEERLVEIWQDLVHAKQVGRHASFFNLGGDSLLVLKALFTINQAFASCLTVRDIYRNPTPAELAKRIREGATEEELVDLAHEAAFDQKIIPKQKLSRCSDGAILMTGATGFVGRFLLAELLQQSETLIYCLVRAPSEHLALSRLRSNFAKWDLWRDDFESRIVAIPYDLRLPRLGLDDQSYEILSQEVDSIYHCATSMNHLETYSMAKPANVDSAREILKLATSQRLKLINYVSTVSVFSSHGVSRSRAVDEVSRIDQEKHPRSRGYLASKWVAENIFMRAADMGVPCNIFRLGLVWADSARGRYDELQREYRMIKSCLLSGLGIRGYRYAMAPIPVDAAARSVLCLARDHDDGQQIFHLASGSRPYEDVFEQCNAVAGTSLELLSLYDWICEIKRLHHAGHSLPAVPLVEYAFSLTEEAFRAEQNRVRNASIRVDCSRTHRHLERAGVAMPSLDDDLLRECVECMLSRDHDLRLGATRTDFRFPPGEAGFKLDA